MKNIIVIAGPTCTGKSELSIRLAESLGSEIVSGDSVQVYKGLDIGSAKVSKKDQERVRHYMIDEVEPTVDYNIYEFQKDARSYIDSSDKNILIIAGGTGFYIQAIIKDINFSDNGSDEALRDRLTKEANDDKSLFYKKLCKLDPLCNKLDENNIKRCVRAMEYKLLTGKSIIEHNAVEKQRAFYYPSNIFILKDDRDKMYNRINSRVDQMIEEGLIDEVLSLIEKYGCSKDNLSMKAIGYKEVFSYLDNAIDKDSMIDLIKKNTRHFAKRQLTWFKHQLDGSYIDLDYFNYNFDDIVEYIESKIGSNNEKFL